MRREVATPVAPKGFVRRDFDGCTATPSVGAFEWSGNREHVTLGDATNELSCCQLREHYTKCFRQGPQYGMRPGTWGWQDGDSTRQKKDQDLHVFSGGLSPHVRLRFASLVKRLVIPPQWPEKAD